MLDIEPETGNLLQTRPAIGGNILATIKTPESPPHGDRATTIDQARAEYRGAC